MVIFNRIKNRYKWIYSRYKDYFYLRNNLLADNEEYKNVFVGSSYTLFGIVPSNNSTVLALQSQDIYYSYKILQEKLKKQKSNNSTLKSTKAFVGLGYYSLYSDLSLTKSDDETNRIYDVYYPLFNDMHNMSSETYRGAFERLDVFDKVLIAFFKNFNKIIWGEQQCSYFDTVVTRESKALKNWPNKEKDWNDLTGDERIEAARMRVLAHERSLKHYQTSQENKKIIREIKKICIDSGYELCVFIAPMTKEYLECMTDDFKQKGQELLDFLKEEEIKVVDCNHYNLFNTEDFVDMDHLSLSGASKLTELLVNILENNK